MFKKKYPTMSFTENFLSGHVNIGKRIVIYGDNAMHWGVTIWTKRWGYICFRLPFRSHKHWWPLYFWCSPNATPWAATFMLGKKEDIRDWLLAPIRRYRFGHNFDTTEHMDELQSINNKF